MARAQELMTSSPARARLGGPFPFILRGRGLARAARSTLYRYVLYFADSWQLDRPVPSGRLEAAWEDGPGVSRPMSRQTISLERFRTRLTLVDPERVA